MNGCFPNLHNTNMCGEVSNRRQFQDTAIMLRCRVPNICFLVTPVWQNYRMLRSLLPLFRSFLLRASACDRIMHLKISDHVYTQLAVFLAKEIAQTSTIFDVPVLTSWMLNQDCWGFITKNDIVYSQFSVWQLSYLSLSISSTSVVQRIHNTKNIIQSDIYDEELFSISNCMGIGHLQSIHLWSLSGCWLWHGVYWLWRTIFSYVHSPSMRFSMKFCQKRWHVETLQSAALTSLLN